MISGSFRTGKVPVLYIPEDFSLFMNLMLFSSWRIQKIFHSSATGAPFSSAACLEVSGIWSCITSLLYCLNSPYVVQFLPVLPSWCLRDGKNKVVLLYHGCLSHSSPEFQPVHFGPFTDRAPAWPISSINYIFISHGRHLQSWCLYLVFLHDHVK